MRGFLKRTPVPELAAQIDKHCLPLADEPAPLDGLAGRVLAQDVVSPVNVPNFDRSAMDGYALDAESTFGASSYSPLEFHVIGDVTPGGSFTGTVGPGEAVRIMTGGPLPRGATAVLMAEHAERSGDNILVIEPVPPGKHVGLVGEDIRANTPLFKKWRLLRPQDVGVLAATGFSEMRVIRKPRVELLITGDELLKPGQPPSGVRIVDSNSVMLKSLAERDGADSPLIRHLRDDRELIRAHLHDSDTDLVCVSGGTSVGIEDHAPTLLAELGTLLVHGIPMRPAAPTGFGLIGSKKVFLLPGNPVSCLSAYDCFVGPALRLLGGLPRKWLYREITVSLTAKIASQIGRIEYVRLYIENGRATPIASGGASILSSTTRADGFLLTEEASEGFAEGETVTAWLYD